MAKKKTTSAPKSKTMIAIPCMDTVHSLFCKSLLSLEVESGTPFGFAMGSLIYDARNQLIVDAINNGYEQVLWLDSDMLFGPNLLNELQKTLDETGADLVTGLYFSRKPPIRPIIFSRCEAVSEKDGVHIYVDFDLDYKKDSVFPIKACGFGSVLMKTKLARDMLERYGTCFAPVPGFGEDMAFCMRANEMNAKMLCDSRIKLGHIGLTSFDEEDYEAFKEES